MSNNLFNLVRSVLTVDECELIKSEMHHYQNAREFSFNYPHLGHYIFAPFFYLKYRTLFDKIEKHIPDGFCIAYDQLIEVHPQQDGKNAGFKWHTGYESAYFMKPPIKIENLWIALVDLDDNTGGRLKVANQNQAVTLAQLARYFAEKTLQDGVTATDLENMKELHRLFHIYLEDNHSKLPTYSKGDGHIFNDLLFHATESPKKNSYSRQAYLLRCLPKDAQFDLDRIKKISKLSYGNYFYQLLLKHNLTDMPSYQQFIYENSNTLFLEHPDLKSNYKTGTSKHDIDHKFIFT